MDQNRLLVLIFFFFCFLCQYDTRMFNFTQNVYVQPKIWMMNKSFSRKSGAYGIGCKSGVRFIDLDFYFFFIFF